MCKRKTIPPACPSPQRSSWVTTAAVPWQTWQGLGAKLGEVELRFRETSHQVIAVVVKLLLWGRGAVPAPCLAQRLPRAGARGPRLRALGSLEKARAPGRAHRRQRYWGGCLGRALLPGGSQGSWAGSCWAVWEFLRNFSSGPSWGWWSCLALCCLPVILDAGLFWGLRLWDVSGSLLPQPPGPHAASQPLHLLPARGGARSCCVVGGAAPRCLIIAPCAHSAAAAGWEPSPGRAG